MSWLVDTNVISELRKGPRCDPAVAGWWRGVEAADVFLSVLTLGEIRRGITLLRGRDPAREALLEAWVAGLQLLFDGRLLPVDAAVAATWGRVSAARSVPAVDALLAATALVHGLTLVTRNVADVAGLGVSVLNPFRSLP